MVPPGRRLVSNAAPHTRERNEAEGGTAVVSRALKHQGLWLTLTYVGLILLMARAYG
jgi:hypothetical protein